MNASRLKLVVGLIVVAGASLILAILGTADSHHTNARYLAWKWGINPGHTDGIRYLNVDVGFRKSLLGRPFADLQRLFPAVQPASESAIGMGYLSLSSPSARLFCIGHSGWYVEVEDGIVRSIELHKG